MRDFLIVVFVIAVAQAGGQVMLGFTGRSVPIVLAVVALVLCVGLVTAALTLAAARRQSSPSR